MPNCCCFHSYELTPVSGQDYRLQLRLEGHGNLEEVVKRSGLASAMSQVDFLDPAFILEGVREPDTLFRFFDLLKHRVIIDLSPELDECYALGPYSLFEGERRSTSSWGNAVNQAKYWRNSSASSYCLTRIEDFIEGHLPIRTVNAIISAPKSDPGTPDLVGKWAQEIARNRGWRRISSYKTRVTGPQKDWNEGENETDLTNRIAHSVGVSEITGGERVLILDDTIRSGGTLKEIARALREAGAREVYGLSVAKDAKFTNGGVGLNKERWE